MVDMWLAKEVCEELGITRYTLTNWYSWEKKALKAKLLDHRVLPIPSRINHSAGQPLYWTKSQVEELKEFQKNIIVGRKGLMGMKRLNACQPN